jgi:excinuclease UvrABC ATPase subunit
MRDNIFVKGAREHNLKNVDVEVTQKQVYRNHGVVWVG